MLINKLYKYAFVLKEGQQAKSKKTGIIPSKNKTQDEINKIHNNSFYLLPCQQQKEHKEA